MEIQQQILCDLIKTDKNLKNSGVAVAIPAILSALVLIHRWSHFPWHRPMNQKSFRMWCIKQKDHLYVSYGKTLSFSIKSYRMKLKTEWEIFLQPVYLAMNKILARLTCSNYCIKTIKRYFIYQTQYSKAV